MRKIFYEQRIPADSSCFVELQFCRLPEGTKLGRIVSVDSIKHFLSDSLFVPDEDAFFSEYNGIFDSGIYNNLETGVVDVYGINYYPPEITAKMLRRVRAEHPADGEALVTWLEKATEYNGFYVLGI